MFLIAGLLSLSGLIYLLEHRLEKSWKNKWANRDITLAIRLTFPLTRVAPALITGVAAGIYWGDGINSWNSFLPVVSVGAMMWLAVLAVQTDLGSHKIPKEACWTIFGIATLFGVLTFSKAGAASAFAGFGFIFFVTVLAALLTKGALGSGDVRLLLALTPISWWAGLVTPLMGVLIASLLQLLYRVFARRRGGLPFAPALIAGLILAVVFTAPSGGPCIEFPGLCSGMI